MDRRGRHRILSCLRLGGVAPAALLLSAVVAHAQQGTTEPAAAPSARGGTDYKASAVGTTRPQPPRAFLDRLSPADREAFQRNLRLWREMSPDERDTVRLRAEQGRAKRKAEAERLLGESGLQLDADRREVFVLRYLQERRRLERDLRQKMEAERARRLPEIAALLKEEFSKPPDPPQNRGPQVPFMR